MNARQLFNVQDGVQYDMHLHGSRFIIIGFAIATVLLARGRYAFIGKGAVYDWLNAYASHDLCGKRKIRNWFKTLGKMRKKSRRDLSSSPAA